MADNAKVNGYPIGKVNHIRVALETSSTGRIPNNEKTDIVIVTLLPQRESKTGSQEFMKKSGSNTLKQYNNVKEFDPLVNKKADDNSLCSDTPKMGNIFFKTPQKQIQAGPLSQIHGSHGTNQAGRISHSYSPRSSNVPAISSHGKQHYGQDPSVNAYVARSQHFTNNAIIGAQMSMPQTNNCPPQLGPPEISKITAELAKKIGSNPNFSAPFFHQHNISQLSKQSSYTAQHDNGWNNSMLVRTTFSTKHVVRGPTQQGNVYKWSIIAEWLTHLSNHCKEPNPKSIHMLMGSTIEKYDSAVHNKTDFMNLTNPELAACMTSTIPFIAYHALKLPSLLASPVPFLKKYQNRTIYLTKKLTCSLLANAFFCTLPEEKDGMQTINFHTMFNTATKGNAKAEKLKCILNYFQEMSKRGQDSENGDRIISLERRCVSKKVDWAKSAKPLAQVEIEPRKKIEEAHGMLKVDFANKRVGGGVMNEGAVMEEILFATCPELIVSRLFTEPLEDDEVLIITGAEQFSNYEGYSRTFSYAGPAKVKKVVLDDLNRVHTPIVVMDALHFKEHEKESQFQKGPIDRELHKAFVAFFLNDGVNIPIATGNWGCGAFNGDPELKFLIQWMSASEAGRKLMAYHTIGDTRQSQSIQAMETFIKRRNVSVGDLYKVVVSYQKKRSKFPSVFEFVKREFISK